MNKTPNCLYKEEIMVARLIAIIAGIVFVACFAGFNLGDSNRCDVNLLFHTFKNVPVFFTVLISFAVGMICALPFALFHRIKKGTKIREEKKSKPETKKTKNKEIPAEDPDQNLTDSIPLTDSETGL